MAALEVTAADDGRTITASRDDEIVVVLPENATTGFRWHPDETGGPLRLVSDGYRTTTEDADEEPVFGRGGLRELRFQVTGGGTVPLSLKLRREWEGEGTEIERFSIVIDATD